MFAACNNLLGKHITYAHLWHVVFVAVFAALEGRGTLGSSRPRNYTCSFLLGALRGADCFNADNVE